jgi:uncharacterized protein (TIGR00369 family)
MLFGGENMATKEAEYLARWEEFERTDSHSPVQGMMGVKLVSLTPTALTMELTDAVRGAAPGSIHGGLLATFADTASPVALWNAFEPEAEIPVTTDMHVRYYRQPQSGPLTAEATVVHRGRRLLSTECSVSDAAKRVLARSTATYMIVPGGVTAR